MIARVHGRSPGDPGDREAGYLPLRCVARGDWQPIQRQPVASWDEAIQICIRDICGQLRRLERFVRERFDVLQHNVAQLVSLPGRKTSIYVDGIPYLADADGAITLPESLASESETGAVKLGETIVDAILAIVSEQRNPDDVPVLADLMENEPLEILTAVARRKPAMLGEVAALMVRVCGENVRGLALKLEQDAAERAAELDEEPDGTGSNADPDVDGTPGNGNGDRDMDRDGDAIPSPIDDRAAPAPSILLDSPDEK